MSHDRVIPDAKPLVTIGHGVLVPTIVADAGERGTRRFLEFFAATTRNRNTRTAYLHAVARFFAWCERHHIRDCILVQLRVVLRYIEKGHWACHWTVAAAAGSVPSTSWVAFWNRARSAR